MEIITNIEITPQMMAKAFWSMGSEDQAEFFRKLGEEIAGDTYHSQVQWFYLEEELRKDSLAKDTLMDIAAPLFWQTMKYMKEV